MTLVITEVMFVDSDDINIYHPKIFIFTLSVLYIHICFALGIKDIKSKTALWVLYINSYLTKI